MIWEVRRQRYRERDQEKMKSELHRKNIQILSNSRQIEVSRGVEKSNVDRCSCREGVEEESKDTITKAQSIHQLSSHRARTTS